MEFVVYLQVLARREDPCQLVTELLGEETAPEPVVTRPVEERSLMDMMNESCSDSSESDESDSGPSNCDIGADVSAEIAEEEGMRDYLFDGFVVHGCGGEELCEAGMDGALGEGEPNNGVVEYAGWSKQDDGNGPKMGWRQLN